MRAAKAAPAPSASHARRRAAIALVKPDLTGQNRFIRHREERVENGQVELPDAWTAFSNRDRGAEPSHDVRT
jgi:hypothetical protein